MPRGRDTSKDPKRVVRDENVYYVNFANPSAFHSVVQNYLNEQQKKRSRANHPSNKKSYAPVKSKPYNWQEDAKD